MKNLITIIALLSCIFLQKNAFAQLQNGNFSTGFTAGCGTAGGSATNWTTNKAEFASSALGSGSANWVDLTPCGQPTNGWGNGAYIEQTMNLTASVPYSFKFDLAAVNGWNWYAADVTISITSVATGLTQTLPVITNDPSTTPSGPIWKANVKSGIFLVTASGNYKVRFTGSGHATSLTTAANTAAYGSSVGVVGIDNIVLNTCKSNPSTASTPTLLYNDVLDGGAVGNAGGVNTEYWKYNSPSANCNGAFTTTVTITNGVNSVASANAPIFASFNGSTFAYVINPGQSLTISATISGTIKISPTTCCGVFYNCYSIKYNTVCEGPPPPPNGRLAQQSSSTGTTVATIYPNPTTGKFSINLNDTNSETVVAIYDLTGRRIVEQVNAANTQMEVDLSEYPSGMYIVNILPENGDPITQKIIKN